MRQLALAVRATAVVLSVAVAASFLTGSAKAQDDPPPFVGWSALMPPLTYQYDPTSEDDCVAGRIKCVEKVIHEMRRRFDPLASDCDHDAVFALAYLRTTEKYLEYAQQSDFFYDAAFVNHQDVVFARMYFDAYDNWHAGRVENVPPAWRIAFAAADARRVSGAGDLLLGISAHVNRDLPFALAAIGMTSSSGTTRKEDHDRVNKILNAVVAPMMQEQAARFDPELSRAQTPYGLGYAGLLQTLVAWRETAWRHAELLVAAPDAATRAAVARQIEDYAAVTAHGIVAGSAYLPPLTSTQTRDAFCAASSAAAA
jgi:hypothetical protein